MRSAFHTKDETSETIVRNLYCVSFYPFSQFYGPFYSLILYISKYQVFKAFLKSKAGKLYRLTLNIKSISYYVFISLFYKHITSLNKLSKTLSHCPKVYNSLFLLLFYYIIYLEAKVRFEKCVILNSPCCFRTEGGPILNSTFRWIQDGGLVHKCLVISPELISLIQGGEGLSHNSPPPYTYGFECFVSKGLFSSEIGLIPHPP